MLNTLTKYIKKYWVAVLLLIAIMLYSTSVFKKVEGATNPDAVVIAQSIKQSLERAKNFRPVS
jgi:hypothetical protein